MGASTVPTTGSGSPCTRAWYVLSTVRLRKASLRREYAYSLFATTMSPEVPTSSRLTTPWRSGAPEVEMRYPAAARPDTTSGPLHPTLGWAATPTGLSTTTMSSSSWTIDMPGTGWAMTCRLGLSSGRGSDTSSIEPAESRSDLATDLPSSTTWPSAARSAALVRETPKSRATPASTRSPSRPSGTRTVRSSGMVVTPAAPVVAPPVDADAEHRQDDDESRRRDDPDVGHVADEPPVVVDEVDDVSLATAGWTDEAVGEVAQGSPEQHAEGDGPGTRAQLACDHDDRHEDGDGDPGHDPGVAGAERERRTGVADELEADELPEEGAGLPVGEHVERDHLAE